MKKRTSRLILIICCLSAFGQLALAQKLAVKQTELRNWDFSKDQQTWEKVTIPHSCNAIDGHSHKYYRGKAYYKCQINATKDDIKKPEFLLFEGAAQAATVSVNGKEVKYHKGGYTPFTISLKGALHEGSNTIEVCTDNHEDVTLIPVSSDFNKNNGLHNPAYLLKMNDVYFSPEKFGMYRLHVSTPYVNRDKAKAKVEASIVNFTNKDKKVRVSLSIKDKNGNAVHKEAKTIELKGGEEYYYLNNCEVANPHLWNGIEDPYLYTVELQLTDTKGNVADEAYAQVGFRYYQTTVNNGFYLNGHKYPLRGISEHQDWDGQASAVTKDHNYYDYKLIQEIGANFIRMAHYPHNDYEFHLCDSLGIIVQTEIPWVNVCGVNAKDSYFDNINEQMEEMIVNLYNHPCIVFWGMWNEIAGWGNNDKLQGKLNNDKVVEQTSRLYRHAKSLDPYRYVGLTDCTIFREKGYTSLQGDFYSENRYPDWYQFGSRDLLTKELKECHSKMGVVNISEYGAGSNPFCHTSDSAVMKKLKAETHYEEYACYVHENDMTQIMNMPFLNFTSLWIMFDFPVADRKEGFMDSSDGKHFTENENRKYMNDKGLVTRDRKIKKDPFYLYKAWWNKKETTVHITGHRRSGSPANEPVFVKVYSNAKSLTLYQNGEKVGQLDKCPSSTGVIWTFGPLKYKTSSDKFKVVSDNGVSDEVEWKAL